MLLRVAKRRAVWDEGDPAEVVRVEFQTSKGDVDLRPSVYDVADKEEALRCSCEHCATFLSPPTKVRGYDFRGAGTPHPDPGATHFTFTRERHREVVFDDEAALVRHVARVVAERADRELTFSTAELRAYVREHANDPEWQAAFSALPHGPRWRRL